MPIYLYFWQGGDLGSLITPFIITRYGTRCIKAQYLSNVAPAEDDTKAGPNLHVQMKLRQLNKVSWLDLLGPSSFLQQVTATTKSDL
jgi:hypothetical protein